MADTVITVPFINGSGEVENQLSIEDGSGNVAPQTALRVNGAFVSSNNPVPVSGSVVVSASQQTMQAPYSVTVNPNTSTLLWSANTSARTLKILPANNVISYFNDTGNAASPSAGWRSITGYVWNINEPPPNANIYVYSLQSEIFTISQGN